MAPAPLDNPEVQPAALLVAGEPLGRVQRRRLMHNDGSKRMTVDLSQAVVGSWDGL